MLRQERGDFLCDPVHRIVGAGFRQVEEDAGDAVEVAAGSFQRFDGVGKTGGIGVVDNGLDVAPGPFDGFAEGRQIIIFFDPVEDGGAVGQRGFREQRILARVVHGSKIRIILAAAFPNADHA